MDLPSADHKVIYGIHPILEQLRRDPGTVRSLLVSRESRKRAQRIVDEARRRGVETVFAEPGSLERWAPGAVHQGVVALLTGVSYADWTDLLATKPGCLVLADQVTDPRNLGAMVRSAEAAGAGGIVIPKDRSAGLSGAAVKAAAGATSFLPIVQVTNLSRAIEQLQGEGYWVVGLEESASQSVFDFRFPEFSAIVAGSEGAGLRALTRKRCDHLVSIPMVGRVVSLNVSVAVAVALFERLRQRRCVDTSPSR